MFGIPPLAGTGSQVMIRGKYGPPMERTLSD
jgi:hypothetical protein